MDVDVVKDDVVTVDVVVSEKVVVVVAVDVDVVVEKVADVAVVLSVFSAQLSQSAGHSAAIRGVSQKIVRIPSQSIGSRLPSQV